jgi:hypothetical protein
VSSDIEIREYLVSLAVEYLLLVSNSSLKFLVQPHIILSLSQPVSFMLSSTEISSEFKVTVVLKAQCFTLHILRYASSELS